MFNYNLGKITNIPDCPSRRKVWQVNGWVTLICSSKQGGCEFQRWRSQPLPRSPCRPHSWVLVHPLPQP